MNISFVINITASHKFCSIHYLGNEFSLKVLKFATKISVKSGYFCLVIKMQYWESKLVFKRIIDSI